MKIIESYREIYVLREKLQNTDQEKKHLQDKKKEFERLAKSLEGEVPNAQIHNEKLQREIDCW